MNVLITGGNGRLGKDLRNVFAQKHTVHSPSHTELDITSYEQVNKYFQALRPELIIHSAAIADADVCQLDPRQAFFVNTIATQNLTLACREHGTTMAFISTDYVFDGTKGTPYTEFDTPNPINVYGQTKLASERFIETCLEKYYIIRTAWLFGVHGNNFLVGVLNAMKNKTPIKAAFDQAGSPTSTRDLSAALLELVTTPFHGIYNIVNRGGLTWYDYAELIMSILGKKGCVEPIRRAQRGPAPRPADTILDPFCLDLRSIYAMPEVPEAIERCIWELEHASSTM